MISEHCTHMQPLPVHTLSLPLPPATSCTAGLAVRCCIHLKEEYEIEQMVQESLILKKDLPL